MEESVRRDDVTPLAVAGIQARMGSSRLARKPLADLSGKPMIRRVWERAKKARHVTEVYVLTSEDPSDDELAAYCEGAGILVRRGPVHDVLARYLRLVEEQGATYVVRITGDCPLISPEFIDLQIEALQAHDGDYAIVPEACGRSVLPGQGVHSARMLAMAARSRDPRDREHVGAFFLARSRSILRGVQIDVERVLERDDLRITVDEAQDLELMQAVYEHFAPAYDSLAPLADVIAWIDAHPEVFELNRGVVESAANRLVRRMSEDTTPHVVGRWPCARS